MRLGVGRGSRPGGGPVMVVWASQSREGLACNPEEMSSLPCQGPPPVESPQDWQGGGCQHWSMARVMASALD